MYKARSLGWEDPLEYEMATCSNIRAWKFYGQRSLAATVHEVTKSRTQLSTHTHFSPQQRQVIDAIGYRS